VLLVWPHPLDPHFFYLHTEMYVILITLYMSIPFPFPPSFSSTLSPSLPPPPPPFSPPPPPSPPPPFLFAPLFPPPPPLPPVAEQTHRHGYHHWEQPRSRRQVHCFHLRSLQTQTLGSCRGEPHEL